MPFIGTQPQVGAYSKLDAITTSATATYNLTLNSGAYYPSSANHLMVSLNGVMQAPQDSFTISGATIIFASTLASTDSIDFIMALGDVLDIGTPSDGTVVTAKMQDAAVTTAKLASTLDLSGKTVTMPAGAVLQVVNMTGSGAQNSSTSTWADSNITLNITPSSTTSKILVTAHITGTNKVNNTYLGLRLVRGSTELSIFETQAGYNATTTEESSAGSGVTYLDSPSTTSATTYKIQFKSAANIATASFGVSGISSITLMEIAG